MERKKSSYATNLEVFGQFPAQIVKRLATVLRPGGRVLDLGAGQGRNGLWLAEQGFVVDAVDRDEDGVRQMQDQAQREGLASFQARLASAEELELHANAYDGLCCINLLQFFSVEQAADLVRRLQVATVGGGYHSILVPSHASEEILQKLGARLWTEEELRGLYSNWSIEVCRTYPGMSTAKNAKGEQEPVEMINFLAKKLSVVE